jgi:4-amino-4-deoxy-L-arabinose transferase-like glycosyltransferase
MRDRRTPTATSTINQPATTAHERGLTSGRARPAGARGAWWESVQAWVTANAVDIAIVAAITALAGVLRLWHVGTIPLGLHGDEAWTGLDARRVVNEGWIGPYVPSALGQPTGPLYFTALLFKFMPDDTTTIRMSMALFGVAAVPAAYLAFATMFNRTVAAFAAVMLATMAWHLHLSRTGFMVASWTLFECLTLWLLFIGLQRRQWWWFVAAGVAHGLGAYSYNAYMLFVPVPFVAIAWAIARDPDRTVRARTVVLGAIFALSALAVAMPLVRYILADMDRYEAHQRYVGLTHAQQWKDADTSGRIELVWDRAKEWNRGLVYGGRPDYGDGLATQGHPVIQPVIYVLALVGLGMAVRHWRRPQYAVLIAAVLILPWGAFLTVNDGLFRRTLGLAPIAAVLAALPLAAIWQRAWVLDPRWRAPVCAGVLLVPLFTGYDAVRQYFGPVQDTQVIGYVYPYQLDAASRYLRDDMPEGSYVYWYSDRWSFNYETRRFLAPDALGVDRSPKFRPLEPGATRESQMADPLSFSLDPALVDPAHREHAVFVFLDSYAERYQDVIAAHPGGQLIEQMRTRDGGRVEVLFRAYVVTP